MSGCRESQLRWLRLEGRMHGTPLKETPSAGAESWPLQHAILVWAATSCSNRIFGMPLVILRLHRKH